MARNLLRHIPRRILIDNLIPGQYVLDMILLVEDDQDNREALEMLLEYSKIPFKSAKTMDEGLLLLKKERPDIFITDYLLDGKNTCLPLIEYCKLNYPQCMSVLITALHPKDERLIDLSKAVDHLFIKPYDVEMLMDFIKTV